MELIGILTWLGLAIGAGAIASSKGRSGFGYFLLGLFLPLIGILIAIGMAPVQAAATSTLRGSDFILCHSCNRPRRVDAVTCPHCGAGRPDPYAGQKKCAACAEWIMADAKKCKHCGEMQPEPSAPRPRPAIDPPRWDKVDEIERDLDQRQR